VSGAEANFWLVVVTALNILGGGFVGWMVWSFRRAFVPRTEYDQFVKKLPDNMGDELREIRDRGARQDERISVLEHQMEGVPSRSEVKDLEVSIANLQGTINGLDTRLDGLNNLVERVENHAKTIDNFLRERDVRT